MVVDHVSSADDFLFDFLFDYELVFSSAFILFQSVDWVTSEPVEHFVKYFSVHL